MAVTASSFNIVNPTPEKVAKLESALTYLQSNGSQMAIGLLETSAASGVKVIFSDPRVNQHSGYGSAAHAIVWNPEEGVMISDDAGNIKGVQSSANVFVHEAAHSIDAGGIARTRILHDTYFNLYEMSATIMSDTVAKDLGEVVRNNYSGVDIKVKNVTSHTTDDKLWVQIGANGQPETGPRFTPTDVAPRFGSEHAYKDVQPGRLPAEVPVAPSPPPVVQPNQPQPSTGALESDWCPMPADTSGGGTAVPPPAPSGPAAFGRQIQAAGLELTEPPVMDGTLQRVAVASGMPGNRDGAYTGHLDGHAHGQITNFASGVKLDWSMDGIALSDKQQGQLAVDTQNARQQRGAELSEQYNNVAARTTEKLDRLPDAPPAQGNAYLAGKQIDAHGVKFDGDKLIIPLRDIDGKVWSAQTIGPGDDGGATFEKGGRRVGNMHIIGDIKPGNDVLVAEGYASGASLHQATGKPVVVAFDARNMDAVVDSVKSRHPTVPLHIMADNIGVEKATAAAEKHQVGIAFPEFKTAGTMADFNELHIREGLPAVKEQVDKAVARSVDHSLEQATTAARAQRGDSAEVRAAAADSKHTGPVTAMTSYHAVQAVGEKAFIAHELRDLPSIPVQDKPILIAYHDGRAQMSDMAPERAAGQQR
ncbi:hypothetical protein RBA41_16800 [Massilia sp. CCM 9210]|uniref:KfrB domain-containing protein n=1 Tax=Massilia scottii TaxID=3057166 RepID=UPI0027968F1A|nr:hypothetical protein [Massilia sp. CCM 9210]MDQ1814969.1 hypothetical protein [Massilia sp. CCM 9210]